MNKQSHRGKKSPTEAAVAESMTSPEVRAQWIAVAAYYRSEHRGFAGGHELDDWLEAEKELNASVGTKH